jgi:hypothetical protein
MHAGMCGIVWMYVYSVSITYIVQIMCMSHTMCCLWVLCVCIFFFCVFIFCINLCVCFSTFCLFLYPRPPEGEGGILFYLCPSFRPSKLFFVAFFSATINGRNLIFGPKLHIDIYAILWVAFLDSSDSYFLFADLVGFNTHWTYMHIFRRIFFSNYRWHKSDIWSQASYRYPISWEAFLDQSDSYFLLADLVDFYTHWTYMYMLIFRHIFLSNYWWQKSDIWSQASYRYPISWEAFFDLSDSYFLFAEERGYHKILAVHLVYLNLFTLFKDCLFGITSGG